MSTCDLAAKLLGRVSVDICDLRSLAALLSEDSRDDRISVGRGLLDLFRFVDMTVYKLCVGCVDYSADARQTFFAKK
jgi:hypothetical protein